MVVKAGPKGEWHCQPDNGTFELWFNGRNLFPDSGSYVYAGDDEVMKLRNWFRRTSSHNTLTLDEKNLQTTQSVTKLWQPEGNEQILVLLRQLPDLSVSFPENKELPRLVSIHTGMPP